MTLGERIKLKRKGLKLTQKQLAEKLGLDHTTISKWESNTYEPDAISLNKLSEVLSTSVDYLLTGKNKEIYEIDPEARALARDIQKLESDNRELLKKLIKSMSKAGEEALDE